MPRSDPLMKSRVIGSFVSSSAGRPSQRIPAYGRGRICDAPHCDTVLSTYNPALYCSLHDVVGMPRRRP
ncbi:MAG TPA: hypothetical protein VFH93_06865 [Thermoleophilia bacterium]|nr:hypothetical protein [Thermoleophilia bacterium]